MCSQYGCFLELTWFSVLVLIHTTGSMGSAVKRSTYTQSVSSTSNAFSTVRSPTHENFCKEEATTTDLKLSDLETPHLDNKNEKKERDTFDGKQSNGHGPIEPTARNSLEGSLLATPNTSYHLDAVKRYISTSIHFSCL